jgi:hypothetical protein
MKPMLMHNNRIQKRQDAVSTETEIFTQGKELFKTK